MNYSKKKHQHSDFSPSRIKKDQQAVHEILQIMSNTFIDPISEQPLLSISTGILASEKVTRDLLSAKSLGEAAMEKSISDRLGTEKDK